MDRVIEFSDKTVTEIASLLQMPVMDLTRESLRVYLHTRLAQVESALSALRHRYSVGSSEEMERLYREGELAEENSWEDFFRFDHLEDEYDSLRRALDAL
jgi:hypothetical protein